MKKLALLTVAMFLTAAGAASAIKSHAPAMLATASLQPATISIQDLHRQVDTNLLSVPEIVGP